VRAAIFDEAWDVERRAPAQHPVFFYNYARMNSVVVVGSINMDQVVHAPRHPDIGETILGSDFRTFYGGKGANQAVAACRCDAFGDAIMVNLKNEGISLPFVRRDPQAPTGVAFIIVDDEGKTRLSLLLEQTSVLRHRMCRLLRLTIMNWTCWLSHRSTNPLVGTCF
jgi:hypothetical protein